MVRLNVVLESILRDLVTAQHNADMHALRLADDYGGRTGMERAVGLTPPFVKMDGVEMTLRCAFVGQPVVAEDFRIDREALSGMIETIASRISDIVVTSVMTTIMGLSADNSVVDMPLERFSQEVDVRRGFVAFVKERIHDCLERKGLELVSANGNVDIGMVREAVVAMAEREIVEHPELKELFYGDSAANVREKIVDNLVKDLNVVLPRIVKGVKVGKTGEFVTMNVEVAADELAELPPEAIQTLRLSVSSREVAGRVV